MTQAWLRKLAFRFGYDINLRRLPQYETRRKKLDVPRDMEPEFVEIYAKTHDYTMTSVESMYALYDAVRQVVRGGIEGDLVECGVWRGGSAMLMARTLMALGETGRKLYLYDTFAGMTRPGEIDRRARDGSPTIPRWEHFEREGYNEWCYVPIEEVRENLLATGFPAHALVMVKGEVEKTLPAKAPKAIALLRLDTDWYQSTYHELVHLYPRLARGGFLLLDDYGSYEGAKQAVDQYFAENGPAPYLHRIDSTARISLK